MKTRCCLYLTDYSLTLYAARPGGLESLLTLAFDEQSYLERWQNFLADNSLGVVSVFIDVMSEEVKHERIPHINNKDRQRLLKRKCKSFFPGADFIWKQHLAREKSGRKDDVYLFLGINLSATVRQITDELAHSGQHVNGIYFLPLLQQQLVRLLPEASQYLLISSIADRNPVKKSYRQTFFKENALAVSRVNGTFIDTPYRGLEQLLKEIGRTYQFLESSRQLTSGSALNVVFILNEQDAAWLIAQNSNHNIACKFAGLNELGVKLGIGRIDCKSLAELLCYMAISKKLPPHFQPPETCHSYRVKALQRKLRFSAVAVVLLSSLVSGGFWFTAEQINNRYYQIASQLLETQKQRNVLAAQLPETEVPPKLMHQAVTLYQQIAQHSRKPEHILPILVRAYQGYQDLDLKRLTWVNNGLTEGADIKDEYNGQVSGDFIETLRAPTQIKLVVSPPSDLSMRTMMGRVDSFVHALQQQPEITQVILQESTIDTRSSAQLEESVGDLAELKRSDFTLLISL